MFCNSERSFGQFEFVASLLPSIISGGMSIGGALIQSSTAKSIASAQQETQLSIAQMGAEVQKRWQELEVQKIQAATVVPQPTAVPGTLTAAPGAELLAASIIPSSILGVPILYLAIGAGLLLFLSRKSGEA